MPADTRVLVVGTTPDYIHCIHRTWPGRALFLTDAALRPGAVEPAPPPRAEILVDLNQLAGVVQSLTEHLRRHDQHLGGIICFDCEAMPLTARLAKLFHLPYPSLKAVELCRDKRRCKQEWQRNGVACPETRIIDKAKEAVDFLTSTGGACVLKPLQGAGSEFVFLCETPEQAFHAVHTIRQGLTRLKDHLLYRGEGQRILAETYVTGPEYSCDFLPEEDRLLLLRVARKIPRHQGPFGTVQAYLVPADLPESTSRAQLEALLARAAQALGLSGVICMVDFIMGPSGPVLLEMAPRPGGDCLPALIQQAGGVNMLGRTLDRAEGHDVTVLPPGQWRTCAGMKLYADCEGVLAGVDTRETQADPRVLEIHVNRHAGHRVVLPPLDYNRWILGHLIFAPTPDRPVESQCEELLQTVRVTMAETS
jgi:biotin carboxylase